MMKTNVALIGLNYEYLCKLGELLCKNSDLYFLDVKGYVEYMLFSRKDMLEKCGKEYLQKQEHSALKSILDFENSIIAVPTSYAVNDKFISDLKNTSFVVFLKDTKENLSKVNLSLPLDKKMDIDLIVYEDRNYDFSRLADLTIEIDKIDIDKVAKQILAKRK